MKSKPTFWQRIGMHDWFLRRDSDDEPTTAGITPDDVYSYIVQKFEESIRQLSFAGRIVFYHEYIIAFNPADYQEFMNAKKGIFGPIIQESVKQFYATLSRHRTEGKTVEPSSSKWVFRFVSHPDYAPGDLGFIGKLLPGAVQQEENLRVTYIPRQTGIAQTADINQEILKDFTFYSEGYYEVPYRTDLVYDEKQTTSNVATSLARLEAILPDKAYVGKKLEYLMRDNDILVTGSEDTREGSNIFRVPSEWVDALHLRIRYDRGTDRFFLASFGEKTVLNEKEVAPSDPQNPAWTELPVNSRLVLNGIVGINLFKS
ncbi:MAG: hypothetical protein JWP27_129 [Flaviaesturariibacter sp.]|nr:hypothetical protein [Flaviaesturariibacter sp.]